jgi:hypothetical protein
MRYRIEQPRAVLEEVKTLIQKVARLDSSRRAQFLDAFKTILQKLETDPAAWGEPERTLPHFKLTIYHGLYSVLSVYYTVLEEQKTVVIQRIKTTLSFPPENAPDENA